MCNQYSSRQLQILISAVELAKEGGFGNITMNGLAKKINVTEGALYKHFKNKQAIIDCMLKMMQADLLNLYNKAKMQSDNSLEVLNNISASQASFFERNHAYAVIILSVGINHEIRKVGLFIKDIIHEIRDIITQVIEKGQKTGYIREDVLPEQLAFIYLSSFRMCVTSWYLSEYKDDIKTSCEELWKALQILFSVSAD